MDERKHFYIITTTGPIAELGGMNGPITSPVCMEPYMAYRALCSGHVIYEVNRFNPNERVKINKFNYNNIKFKDNRALMIKRQVLNNEVHNLSKKENKLGSSNKNKKEDDKKAKLEANEGKTTIEVPKAKVEESPFKATDFQKDT